MANGTEGIGCEIDIQRMRTFTFRFFCDAKLTFS